LAFYWFFTTTLSNIIEIVLKPTNFKRLILLNKSNYSYLRRSLIEMIKQLNTLLLLGVFLSTAFIANAQIPVFTQSYASHLNLNPALAGLSHSPTVVLNYRNQWADFDGGFKTYSASVDKHFGIIRSGIGLSIVNDKAMKGIVSNLAVSGHYSYYVPVNKNWGATMGFQATFNQRVIDADALLFGDQIDPNTGTINGDLSTNEVMAFEEQKNYFGLSGGFMVFSQTLYFGAAFKNINQPNISVVEIADESRLPMYISAHAGNTFYFDLGNIHPYVTPNIFFANQGKYNQVMLGAQAGLGVLFGGLWARHNITNFDALMFLLGVEKNIFKFGYSYDMSVGQPGNFIGNTHELSLVISFLEDPTEAKKRRRTKGLMCPNIN